MNEDTTYNGYTNYPTWVVNLWIDNEEGSQTYWREVAEECYRDATPAYDGQTQKDAAIYDLSQRLKGEFEEGDPFIVKASVYADLMGWALSSVNWHEIAEGMLEEYPDNPESDNDDTEESEE